MDRTVFYAITSLTETLDNTTNNELDMLYNNMSKFTMTYPVGYYRVSEYDIMRPDTISTTAYGTTGYWWLICFVNGIYDPFNDLDVGMQLKIPNILDIQNFYKKYRLR